MKTANIANQDEKFAKLRTGLSNEVARINRRNSEEDQAKEWLSDGPKWDIGITLHTPLKLRYEEQGYDELWLEGKVSVLFNLLSKVIFSGVPKRQRPMLRRVITLEKDTNVGWHVHGVISTPSHLDNETLVEAISTVWGDLMNHQARRDFKDRLVWCEQIRGNYQQYCVKFALSKQARNYSGQYGTISLRNTHL
jgi:hypothetical protein